LAFAISGYWPDQDPRGRNIGKSALSAQAIFLPIVEWLVLAVVRRFARARYNGAYRPKESLAYPMLVFVYLHE
jgi:hypothetical protein